MKLSDRKHGMCVLFVCFFPIIFLSSCGNEQAKILDPETLDLFETFFRYKFDNNYSGAQKNADAYFLEIQGEDPSPEFLARFKGHSPPVKKGSDFVLADGIVEGNGLLFRIDSYRWIGRFNKNSVEIRGGYDEGNLSASWASYIWVIKNGKWKLKSVSFGAIAVAENGKEPDKMPLLANSVNPKYNFAECRPRIRR
jgi:hypothetical protein